MNKYSKKLSYFLVVILVVCNCYVVEAATGTIKLGGKVQGALGVESSADYIFTADTTMKVKFKVNSQLTGAEVNNQVDEEDRDFEIFLLPFEDYHDYLDTNADDADNDVDDNDENVYDEYGNDDEDDDDAEDDFDFIIRDFVDIGEEYSDTIEIPKGKYVFVIDNDKCDITYTVSFEDISNITLAYALLEPSKATPSNIKALAKVINEYSNANNMA